MFGLINEHNQFDYPTLNCSTVYRGQTYELFPTIDIDYQINTWDNDIIKQEVKEINLGYFLTHLLIYILAEIPFVLDGLFSSFVFVFVLYPPAFFHYIYWGITCVNCP